MDFEFDERTKLLSKKAKSLLSKNDGKAKTENLCTAPYFHLFKYASNRDKAYMGVGAIFSLVSACALTTLSFTISQVTNSMVVYVTNVMHATSNATVVTAQKDFMEDANNFLLINCLLGVLCLVCTYLATVLFSYSAVNQTCRIRDLFLSKILNQDIGWYDVNQTGDFASRVADDLRKVHEGIGEKVAIVINFVGIFVSSVIQALIIGWELALICMASLPVSLISLSALSWVTSTYTKREITAYGTAGAIAEEVLSAIRTVVAFGGQKKEEKRYNELLEYACQNNIKRSLWNGICVGAMWLSTYACYAAGFWFGVQLILKNRYGSDGYDVGDMVAVFFSVVTGTWFLTSTVPYIEIFGMAQGAAVRIFEVIASDPNINTSKGLGIRLKKVDGRIVFRDVYFSYPSRPDVKVLQGFNLTINPGETVALVGSSGCGKSTCVHLLQRHYDPNFGSVSIDNYKLPELDLSWIRSKIGVVGQEPVLFETTIAENIKLGTENATPEEIEEAAKKANAHLFIDSFPMKYETVVGERGTQLSGGQKQRIAIARALVRKPSILLLDEATSALDTGCEAVVQAALEAASSECTTIIVAHRLSTIKRADRIVVILKGRVQEEGTHEELMEKKGAYYTLVMSQIPDDDFREGEAEASPTPESKELVQQPTEIVDEKRRTSLFAEAMEEFQKFNIFSVGPIMKYNAPEWWAIAVGCCCSLINGAGLPAYAVVFGMIMGNLVNDDPDYVYNQTMNYVICFFVIAIVIGLAALFQTYMFGIAGEKLTQRLRGMVFQAYLAQDMSYFDKKSNSVGVLCSKLSSEAASVQGATGQRIGTILSSMSNVIFALIAAFYFEWRITLASLCLAPIIGITTYLEPKLMQHEDEVHYRTLHGSTKIAVEAINGIRTVASLGCEKKFYDLYMDEINLYQRKSKRNTHFRATVYGLSRGLLFFTYGVILYYGSILIKNENLEYYRVLIVAESVITSSWSIATALAFTPNFQKGLTAANRIMHILNRVPLVRDGSAEMGETWKHPNVEYKEVYFSYPSRPRELVLKNFNFRVFQGKMVALVGPSGCGKSTIVQLLERFYDPTSGTISVDDTPIHTMHLSALRSQLGTVSQEPNLFSLTIAENIAYGDNSRHVPRVEIIGAAMKANIHDFITSLPLGYDTKLGEKGTQLSGGQKQRIAIARALIRNPKILLLDEATSALDAESEKIVQEALDNAKKGRTCITIAHRLNTIQDADVICVISQGKVAEMGTHSELLNLRGLYHNLHNMQR